MLSEEIFRSGGGELCETGFPVSVGLEMERWWVFLIVGDEESLRVSVGLRGDFWRVVVRVQFLASSV